MTTGIVRPNAEYNCQWNGPASNCYDAVTQPTAGDGNYCECDLSDDGLTQEFSMGTISPIQANSLTQVVVWIYGRAEDTNVQPELDLYVEGGYTSSQTCTFTTSDSWKSYTFTGLTGSQADLDALRVRFIAAPAIGSKDEWWLDVMYCEVTYTIEAAPEAKGCAQTSTANGVFTKAITQQTKGVTTTASADMAVTTPFRALSFTQTATGTDSTDTPYREMGFIHTAQATDLFNILKELGFVSTAQGVDVFIQEVLDALIQKEMADSSAATDAFTIPYKELGTTDISETQDTFTIIYKALGFIDTSTAQDTFTIVYKTLSMIDTAYASDVFTKQDLASIENVILIIDITNTKQIHITSSPYTHEITTSFDTIKHIHITTGDILN